MSLKVGIFDHPLGTALQRILFTSLAGIFLVGLDPRKRGRKLLLSVCCISNHLKGMSRGLFIARLIVSSFLEIVFIGKEYSSKPW